MPSEIREIMTAMDQYYAELSSIEMMIRNWDPIKMTMVIILGSEEVCANFWSEIFKRCGIYLFKIT